MWPRKTEEKKEAVNTNGMREEKRKEKRCQYKELPKGKEERN